MNLLNALKARQKVIHQHPAPEHGGKLLQAAAGSLHPVDHWLDLSTGINPQPWCVSTADSTASHKLPEDLHALVDAARSYYFRHCTQPDHIDLIAAPGSQWIIQHLPRIVASACGTMTPVRVWVPDIGFAEHAYWWEHYGHQVEPYREAALGERLTQRITADVVVIINPNNPSTQLVDSQLIHQAAARHSATMFVVDEAFIDTQPQQSMLSKPLPDNVVVLRSMGKFFGLAGLRVGVCAANRAICQLLTTELGPWPIATASQQLATQALLDQPWQQQAMKQLQQRSTLLADELNHTIPGALPGTQVLQSDLFVTLQCTCANTARYLHEALMEQAVLTRLFVSQGLVRVGLVRPVQDKVFSERLRQALDNISTTLNLS